MLSSGKLYSDSGEYANHNLRDKFVCGFVLYCLFVASIVLPGLSLIDPQNKFTTFSALPLRWQTNLALTITVFIEACAWIKIVVLHLFLVYIGYAYILTNLFWLDRIW